LVTSGIVFFQHSKVILDGPAALLLGDFLIVCSTSSKVNSAQTLSKALSGIVFQSSGSVQFSLVQFSNV
jgi:hypothetical protein